MRLGIKLIRKLCDRVSCGKTFFRVLLKQWIMYAFGKSLCDSTQGVEWFSAHPRYFPSQVPSLVKFPPPPEINDPEKGHVSTAMR